MQPMCIECARRLFIAGLTMKEFTRVAQWANQRLNTLVLDEDIDLVDNVQQGLQTRGYECGPLSKRETAVAWFADRIRADLAPALADSPAPDREPSAA